MSTSLPNNVDFQHTISVCEMLYGQPEAYYHQLCESKMIEEFDFSAYHLLITGLACSVYRPYFGIDAFSYTTHYAALEQEIHQGMQERGVSCITTMLLYDHSKRMCLLFNAGGKMRAQEIAEMVSSCFNCVYDRIFDMSKTPYRNYTVLSDEVHGYEQLQRTFREIDALSRQQFFDMRSMVMTPPLLESIRIPLDPEQVHEELMQMSIAMRAGDVTETMDKYSGMMERLCAARNFDMLSDALSSIRMTLEGILISHGIEMNEEDRSIFSISTHPTFGILSERLACFIRQSLHRIRDVNPMSAPVLEAVRYIRHHYSENISVTDIAEHIGMSDNWLYKHFKKECGCSILTYLMNVRVECAATLLAQTDMLILEIASAVGFENSGYFISVFKKTMGMTPKAYRENHRV